MMDIDNISLTDARGKELIRNGDFSAGVISLAGFLLLLPAAGFQLYRTHGLAWAEFIAMIRHFNNSCHPV